MPDQQDDPKHINREIEKAAQSLVDFNLGITELLVKMAEHKPYTRWDKSVKKTIALLTSGWRFMIPKSARSLSVWHWRRPSRVPGKNGKLFRGTDKAFTNSQEDLIDDDV